MKLKRLAVNFVGRFYVFYSINDLNTPHFATKLYNLGQNAIHFRGDDVLIMVIAAVPEALVAPIVEGLTPFLNQHSGVMFISDIQVTRAAKFSGENRT